MTWRDMTDPIVTGQTHRMISKAAAAVFAGEPVLLVGHTQRAARDLADRLETRLVTAVSQARPENPSIRVTCPGEVSQLRGVRARVFIDHAARPLISREDVYELRMISLGSEGEAAA